jgi:hypothetical protein
MQIISIIFDESAAFYGLAAILNFSTILKKIPGGPIQTMF